LKSHPQAAAAAADVILINSKVGEIHKETHENKQQQQQQEGEINTQA